MGILEESHQARHDLFSDNFGRLKHEEELGEVDILVASLIDINTLERAIILHCCSIGEVGTLSVSSTTITAMLSLLTFLGLAVVTVLIII
mmetsp:Transcript_32200/g.44915  ORF Transcript_32200/g.44915 Transcript_32200/m.44915 type:complete len:90 (+) Transcript_32200:445-714(+)